MASLISKLHLSFLRKKGNASTISTTPSMGLVHSESDLNAREKELVQVSSASFVSPSPTKKGMMPGSARSANRLGVRSIALISKSNSKSSSGQRQAPDTAPQVSLDLSKESAISRGGEMLLPNAEPELLDKRTLDRKRLGLEEVLQLLQWTGPVIVERGLNTLGIFRPHWHSEHFDLQQMLLSTYFAALASSNSTTIAPSPSDVFLSELQHAADIHDITSVLKWGLRHLELDPRGFGRSLARGSDNSHWSWYHEYIRHEREAGYPASAFTLILLPSLSPIYANFLKNLFDVISSVAAHVVQNAMSGNRLSKALAHWVIGPRNTGVDSFTSFYQEWEVTSQAMEHLFLSFVRDMGQRHKLPTRLAELVSHYPFSNPSPTDELLAPRPSITTHRFKALLVRIRQNRPSGSNAAQVLTPLQLIHEALQAADEEYAQHDVGLGELWGMLKFRAMTSGSDNKQPLEISLIVAEESLRVLNLLPNNTTSGSDAPASSTRAPMLPLRGAHGKRRSFSMDHGMSKALHGHLAVLYEDPSSNARGRSHDDLGTHVNGRRMDWDSFSSSGFGLLGPSAGLAESLSGRTWHDDSGVHNGSDTVERSQTAANSSTAQTTCPSYVTSLSVVPLDEAFVDLWNDALLDPSVQKDWPEFVLCQLSDSAKGMSAMDGVEWLIIERSVVSLHATIQARAIQRSPSNVSAATTTRFTRSFGRATAELASRKRFSFFSTTSARSIRGRKQSSVTIADDRMSEGPSLPVETAAAEDICQPADGTAGTAMDR